MINYLGWGRERERGGERDRERLANRQTDRQTDIADCSAISNFVASFPGGGVSVFRIGCAIRASL